MFPFTVPDWRPVLMQSRDALISTADAMFDAGKLHRELEPGELRHLAANFRRIGRFLQQQGDTLETLAGHLEAQR